jgi:hypothetical protein
MARIFEMVSLGCRIALWGLALWCVAVLVIRGLDALAAPLLRSRLKDERKRAAAARLDRLHEAAREHEAHVLTPEDLASMREELDRYGEDVVGLSEKRTRNPNRI